MTKFRPVSIEARQRVLGDLALEWTPSEKTSSLKDYALKHGVGHLLILDRKHEAEAQMLELGYIANLLEAFSDRIVPLNYWRVIGLEKARTGYKKAVKTCRFLHRPQTAEDMDPTNAFKVSDFLKTMGLQVASRTLYRRLNEWTAKLESNRYGEVASAGAQLLAVITDSHRDPEERMAAVVTGLAYFGGEFGAKSEIVCKLRQMRSNINWSLGEKEAAKDELREAISVMAKLPGSGAEKLLSFRRDLAAMLASDKEEGATVMMRDVMLETDELLGSTHPMTLGMQQKLGVYLYNIGEKEEAYQLCHDAYEKARGVLGDQDLVSIELATELGELYSADKNDTQSARYKWAAIRGGVIVGHPSSPDTLKRFRSLYKTLTKAGDIEGIRELYRWRLGVHEERDGALHLNTLKMRNNLGLMLLGQQAYVEAKAVFEALEGDWPETEEDAWRPLWSHALIALCAVGEGVDPSSAEVPIKALSEALGEDHQYVVSLKKRLTEFCSRN